MKYKNYIVCWQDGAKSFIACTEDYFKKTYISRIPKEIQGFYQYRTQKQALEAWPYMRAFYRKVK